MATPQLRELDRVDVWRKYGEGHNWWQLFAGRTRMLKINSKLRLRIKGGA